MIHHRGYCHDVEALHLKVVALCAVFWLTAFGPCTMTGSENLMGYDEHESYKTDFGLVPVDVLVRVQTSVSKLNLDNICRRSELFCFPSTLSGFFSDFHITEANVSGNTVVVGSMQPTDDLWSSNRANFRLLNGDFVSCSLESTISASEENDTSSVGIESNQLSDFLSRDVRISHPVLDWGQKYLHFPSLAYLTVENRHKSSVLNVFEPYSTDKQFYPCNYSEFKIGPGDTVSLCFVFLPKWLGLSSAHLILQTSSGGFLVRAQGFAVQPPYMLQSSLGSSPWVISISNPSKTVLHLKEVSAWMSFSSRNLSYTVNGVCSRIDHPGSFETSVTEWLDVKIGQRGMAIQPQRTWTVGSNSSEPILVIEFPYHSQRNVYGSFCMQLLNNASIDNLDTVIFEAEFGGKPGSYELETDSLISLNVLTPCDANGTISVSVLVENDGPTLLNVVKIRTVGENTESLQTKYVGGLILFPRTVTHVAMVTYTPRLHANLNCKLIVSTNKSNSPDFEVACSNIAGLCSHSHHVHLPLELKATETVEADESILANWRSHRTENGRSVLDDHEVIFPVVRIGAHHSKWIKVKNPSDQPVVMQLLLNSGEIINECREDRESDESFQTYSSYNLVLGSQKTPLWHGFSVPYNALTEAYVHPHGKTVLGPIVFHPSSQCAWKSSALVRNNLSGVEWLSLRGSGGLVSLTLHDGSGPLRSIELKHDYGHPFMKVLFAKNTGDLPLKVNEVTVSGTRCELDGFVVGNCKGFALQPGESQKVIVSYRAGICADTVLRDLEFVTTGGILVVPVKIALPKPILVICKRSVFCMRFKKFLISVSVLVSVVIFVATSCTFTVITKGGNQFKTHSSDVYLEPDASNKVVTSSPLPPPPPLPSSPQLSSPKPLPPPKPPLSSSPSPPQSPPLPSPPQPSSLRPSPPPSPLKLKSMEIESPKPENLTIQTGKNKARRKKKKRSSGTGLTGHVDGSSSHSSSSTPSSPSSVVKCSTPTTPKRSPELSPNRPVQARSPFNHRGFNTVLPVKEKASPPKITSPFARAPEPVKRKESSGNNARFEYNVWGFYSHLQLRGPGQFEVGSDKPIIAKDNNFVSFFERDLLVDFKGCKQNDK